MRFVFATGGREKYFKASNVGDCVCRAICNASGEDYLKIYNWLNDLAKRERVSKRKRSKSSARNGVYKDTYKQVIESLGFKWVSTMSIGGGCTTHLCENDLPKGTLIVRLSKHLTCVKDGVIYDTYDCSRDEKRCVYGYWVKQ